MLSLLLLITGSRLDPVVNLQVDNAPLSVVMDQIGEAMGAKIVVRGGAARDWVCVDFREKTGIQALDALAALCDATWTEKNGTITFTSPWPMADPAIPIRRAAIANWLAKNPSPPPVDQKAAAALVQEGLKWQGSQLPGLHDANNEMSRRSPIPRAILRLIHALGSDALAEIPDGEERSYLLNPPERCLRLPRGSEAIFADLDQERQTLAREMAARGMTAEAAQLRGEFPMFFYFYMAEMPSPLLWCLTVRNSWGELSVDLRAFGGEWMIEHLSMRQDVPLTLQAEEIKDGLEPLSVPYEMPQDWWTFAHAPQGMANPLRSGLLDNSQDFLTSRFHHAIRAAGKQTGSDVAAIVPDGAFLWATGWDEKDRTLAEVIRKGLMTSGEMRMRDGIALIRPRDLRESRLSRAPRRELAAYLAENRRGLEALDWLADIAIAAGTDLGLRTATTFISLSVGMEDGLTMDPRMLRLYGSLSRQQRNDAKSGGFQIAYGNLRSEQKEDFESLFRSQYAGLDPNTKQPAPAANTYSSNRVATDLKLALPQQLDAGTMVTFRLTGEDLIYGRDPQKPTDHARAWTPESLAYARVYMESQTLGVSQFCQTTVKHLQLVLDSGSRGLFVRSSSSIGIPDASSRWIPYADMPEDFRRRHEDAVRGHRENKQKSGSGSSSQPPP